MARKNFEITPEQIKDFQEATLMDDDFMREFFNESVKFSVYRHNFSQ